MRLNSREWDRTFGRYMQFSKREFPTALNSKAFFIARRAVVETPKAKLSRLSRSTREVLGKIINQRHGQRGEKGLYGLEMAKAVEILYASRRRSVAFLKSGWLPAIRRLELAVEPKYRRGAPKNDRAAKQFGKPKGRAIPANAGWRCRVLIENAALSDHDKKDALELFGGPALQRAFDFEAASMKNYIAKKLREGAKAHGIRTR